MGMTIEVDLDGIVKMLDDFAGKANKIAATSLYKGAGIVADALTAAINNIKTEPFHYAKDGEMRLPSPEEKAALGQGKYGVAKFRGSGTEIETSIGVGDAGYATLGSAKRLGTIKSGKHKGERGVPIPLIANSIEHGTSFMQKQPFRRLAFSRSKNTAVSAIGAAIEQQLQEIADNHN